MPSGSTPTIGASPPILPSAVKPTIVHGTRANIRISILSPTGVDSQIGHDGATWLDRELASPNRTTLANTGFGREVTEAMERRRQSLVNMGHAVRLEGRTYPCVKGFCRQSGGVRRLIVSARPCCRTRSVRSPPPSPANMSAARLSAPPSSPAAAFAMIDDASASSWCRGNPCSTSASASISPARCAMLAASNGVRQETGAGDVSVPMSLPACRQRARTGVIPSGHGRGSGHQ